MGTLLFVLLVVLVLAALVGAGGYSVRRYWSPAGSEVVTEDTTAGAGAGIAAAVLAMLVLLMLFFGFTQWNWFGARSAPSAPGTTTVTSPASGGSTHQTPPASPAATPS